MKIFFSLLLVMQFCFAGDVFFGSVYKLQGDAYANNKPLKIDDKVYVGDMITTKSNSKLLIKNQKGTQITLGANTKFTITKTDEIKYNQGKTFFNFIAKQLRKTEKSKFNIKLKSASMGIRGTNFIVDISKNDQKVLLRNGKLEIKNDKDEDFALYNKKSKNNKDGVDTQKEAYNKYSKDFNNQFEAYKRKDQFEFQAYVKQFDMVQNTQVSFGNKNEVYKEPLNLAQLEDAFNDFDSFSDFTYDKSSFSKQTDSFENSFESNDLEKEFNAFDTKGF